MDNRFNNRIPGMPVPLSTKYNYSSLFGDICRSRFYHLVIRFIPIVGIQVVLFISIFYGEYSSIFGNILNSLLYKFPVFYLSALLVVFTRKNYLHVQYYVSSNIFISILRRVFSIKTIVYLISNVFTVILFSDLFQAVFSVTLRNSYIYVVLPLCYTLQHVTFDLDRLPFKFEIQHQPPNLFINKRLKPLLIKALILTFFIMCVVPILLKLVTRNVWSLGVLSYIQYLIFSLITVTYLEFINLAFTAHMIIGCVHKGKLISSLSASPVETLISGLNSNKNFTKLTAFQELCYRATATDPALRTPIYQARLKNNKIWPAILNECILLTEANNELVSKYMQTLQNSLQPVTTSKLTNNGMSFLNTNSTDANKIFGNDKSNQDNTSKSTTNGFLFADSNGSGSNSINKQSFANRITVKNGDILINDRSNRNASRFNNRLFHNTHVFDEPVITHKTKLMLAIQKIYPLVMIQIQKFFLVPKKNTEKTQTLSILETLNISKIRIAEKLIPLPVTQGYCTIALMGLFIHGLDEDPKGSIVSSVGDVLKLLERSVGSLGKYADWKPDSKKEERLDNVSKLYELSINVFLEVVLKYNVLLNDVYLDKDVIILSKWVLNMCNEEV